MDAPLSTKLAGVFSDAPTDEPAAATAPANIAAAPAPTPAAAATPDEAVVPAAFHERLVTQCLASNGSLERRQALLNQGHWLLGVRPAGDVTRSDAFVAAVLQAHGMHLMPLARAAGPHHPPAAAASHPLVRPNKAKAARGGLFGCCTAPPSAANAVAPLHALDTMPQGSAEEATQAAIVRELADPATVVVLANVPRAWRRYLIGEMAASPRHPGPHPAPQRPKKRLGVVRRLVAWLTPRNRGRRSRQVAPM